MLNATRATVRLYSWGALLTIEAGSALTVVVHPDALPVIEAVRDRGIDGEFVEETGRTWQVRRAADGALVFATRGVSKVRLDAARAAGLAW